MATLALIFESEATKKKCLLKVLSRHYVVGATGFEPATSCSQSKHSSRAELRPVVLVC
jgi:hypothetical protein